MGVGDTAGMAPSRHRWATCFTTNTTIHCLLPAPPPCPITQPGSACTHTCTHVLTHANAHHTRILHTCSPHGHVHTHQVYTTDAHTYTPHTNWLIPHMCTVYTQTCTHMHTPNMLPHHMKVHAHDTFTYIHTHIQACTHTHMVLPVECMAILPASPREMPSRSSRGWQLPQDGGVRSYLQTIIGDCAENVKVTVILKKYYTS